MLDEFECLKAELTRYKCRLDEAEKIANELRKENERLKAALSEQEDDLLRYEGQIEAFKYVVSRGRLIQ